MHTIIELNLPEDFNTLCSIYQIKPQYFIQKFINQVSFPEYYSNPTYKHRWGTLFFLQFLEVEEGHYSVDREMEEQYLTLFNRSIKYDFEANPVKNDDALSSGREIMREWLKVVLAERAKYLTDNM